MAKLKKIQNLPDIQWNENEHSRVWKLIVEISAKANYKVLFGKKDQHEVSTDIWVTSTNSRSHQNTSGETKASVYKWIGAIVLPECYEIDDRRARIQVASLLYGWYAIYIYSKLSWMVFECLCRSKECLNDHEKDIGF